MSVELRDVALSVKPGPLQEYLRSRGWQLNGGATESRRVASWAREGVVLEVPQRVDFADYSRRIAELLALLGELETRSPFALADDLIQPPGDVLGIRVDSEAARNGTLQLVHSLRLREAAKNLLLASAHSVTTPLIYFPRMSRPESTALLESVREGQNQRGSFIARLIVPMEPAVGDQLDVDESPFGRRVVTLLMQALERVHAVRSLGGYDELLSMAGSGVSGNLLAALHAMRGAVGAGSLELSVNWGRNRAIPTGVASKLNFPAESLDGLGSLAQTMRTQAQTNGFSVQGFVTRLDRNAAGTSGDVVIAVQDDEVKRVAVHLDAASYAEAIQAHEAGASVQVVGTLQKQGRSWVLTDASGFEALPGEDAAEFGVSTAGG